MPVNSRRKGHNYEREMCRWYRAEGYEVERGIQTRRGGEEAADVSGVSGLHIECKRVARSGITTYCKQAAKDCPDGWRWVLHQKTDREEPTVTVSLDFWRELKRSGWESIAKAAANTDKAES